MKNSINKITSDSISLFLADPITMFQKLQDSIEDIARVYKVLKAADKAKSDTA